MEFIQIEGTNIRASRIGLGTWAIGGWLWGGAEDNESVKTIHAALAKGINLIDTAPVYGFGRAEEVVGRALQEFGKRDQVIIATKAGLEWRKEKIFRNSSSERLRQELEDSLRRLRTDYIDLYQIHWPDSLVPIEETAKAMDGFLKEGKVRAIGVSNFSSQEMMSFRKVAPLHTNQPPYNLFERGIEKEILPFCRQNKIAVLAYSSLCRGLLSGKMTEHTRFNADDIRRWDPKFQSPRFNQYIHATSSLNALAKQKWNKNILGLALRWILDQGNTIALWGARRPDQLERLQDAFGWTIDPESMKEIDQILKENIQKPIGPEFLAPPVREGHA